MLLRSPEAFNSYETSCRWNSGANNKKRSHQREAGTLHREAHVVADLGQLDRGHAQQHGGAVDEVGVLPSREAIRVRPARVLCPLYLRGNFAEKLPSFFYFCFAASSFLT